MLKIALVIGSTRPNRFADHPARWIQERAHLLGNLELDALDLRDQALPFFDEPQAPAMTGGRFSNPAAQAWDAKLARYDGFVVTVAEYNHGMAAVLKNALDCAYNGWKQKPMAFVGYGGAGGARAIEMLRMCVINLQVAPISASVNIPMQAYLTVVKEGASLSSFEYLNDALAALFKQLIWWAEALKAARGASGT